VIQIDVATGVRKVVADGCRSEASIWTRRVALCRRVARSAGHHRSRDRRKTVMPRTSISAGAYPGGPPALVPTGVRSAAPARSMSAPRYPQSTLQLTPPRRSRKRAACPAFRSSKSSEFDTARDGGDAAHPPRVAHNPVPSRLRAPAPTSSVTARWRSSIPGRHAGPYRRSTARCAR